MKISSPAFTENQPIPAQFTCDGEGINPPLQFSEIPQRAQSLTLILDDPDSPSGIFTHWILYNLDPKVTDIAPNSLPTGSEQGRNTYGNLEYGGPCPHQGRHRYVFILYALDTKLSIKAPNRQMLEEALDGHVLETAQLIGTYERDLRK